MPSPQFAINGGLVGIKASVPAGGGVQAILDSADGVRQVVWTVIRTDETTTPAAYTLAQSGGVGQQVDTAALTVGTCAILQAEINGGIDTATGLPAPELTRATAKFYVPTADGIELLAGGEQEDANRESSATHGMIDPLNQALRKLEASGTSSIGGAAFATSTSNVFTDVGALVVDVSSSSSVGRVLEFVAVLSSTGTAEIQLINQTLGAVLVTGSGLSSASATPVKVIATIAPGATFDDTAEQLLTVQLRDSTGADVSTMYTASVTVRYA
jgi:hypothetical protein